MKNKIRLLCVVCFAAMIMIGCQSKNDGIKVTFDAYQEYSGAVLKVTEDGELRECESTSYLAGRKKTVEKILKKQKVSSIEPVCEYDEFEGWMEYEVVTYTDENGRGTQEYQKSSEENLYSWEEVLERKIEAENTVFVAKWKSIPMGAYFTDVEMGADEISAEYSLTLYANGGILKFLSEEPFETDIYTYWLESEKAFQESMDSQVSDELIAVEKETKEFAGWTIYEGDQAEWTDVKVEAAGSQCFELGENVYLVLMNSRLHKERVSTEALKEIFCEGKCYYAVANWK